MSQTDRYRAHLATMDDVLGSALERAAQQDLALDGVFLHAGRVRYRYADDNQLPFHTTPHFRRFTPMPGPEHLVVARPGKPLLVVRVQPRDYWYDSTPPPASYWEAAVDLHEAGTYAEAVEIAKAQIGSFDNFAYIGDSPEAAAEAGFPAARIDPPALLAPLDWARAYKTEYEVELIRQACKLAAGGHLAARDAFEAGASELEIHWAFLRGSQHIEEDLPFNSIAALDEKAATLHYHPKRGPGEARGDVLLMDSGATCEGYASDLTRTWARPRVDPIFRALLLGMDVLEQELVAMVAPGRPYLEIHLAAHHKVAKLMIESGLATGSADAAVAGGVTSAFFPHGVGHHMGIQVHDVGGHMAGPEGGTVPPPPEHPYLRNTRIVEPGHILTIEPGLYFIEMLLEPLRESKAAKSVNWPLVDKLAQYGGVRIEDNVVCTEDGYEDLSRPFLPGPS